MSTPKVALVTGGTHSIGGAIVHKLATAGAKVAIHYHSSEEAANNVVQELRTKGAEVASFQADLSDLQALEDLFKEVSSHFGSIDVFVANAGVPAQGQLLEVTPEDFDRVFAINTRSTFFCLQQAAKHLSEGGRIINISSSQTVHPASGFSVYGGSKAAAKLFVEVLAQELGERSITVNSVVAGPVDSGFLDAAEQSYKDRMASANAFGRLATPEDIADVVAFLASESSRWITGQHIVVDGGATHF